MIHERIAATLKFVWFFVAYFMEKLYDCNRKTKFYNCSGLEEKRRYTCVGEAERVALCCSGQNLLQLLADDDHQST